MLPGDKRNPQQAEHLDEQLGLASTDRSADGILVRGQTHCIGKRDRDCLPDLHSHQISPNRARHIAEGLA